MGFIPALPVGFFFPDEAFTSDLKIDTQAVTQARFPRGIFFFLDEAFTSDLKIDTQAVTQARFTRGIFFSRMRPLPVT